MFEKLRKEYEAQGLDETTAGPDPIEQFRRWLAEAMEAGIEEANAMTLATAMKDGRPSARMVLLKGLDTRGFTFFTNYHSRKARELEANPYAALVFYWPALHRQVRVAGPVERVSAAEADAYFATRPLEAQLAAWASDQSQALPDRAALEAAFERRRQEFAAGPVPRPPFWGGYRLLPEEIEFWQGRPHRLHDRLLYQREGGGWIITRLAP